jgi:hypothetical protein
VCTCVLFVCLFVFLFLKIINHVLVLWIYDKNNGSWSIIKSCIMCVTKNHKHNHKCIIHLFYCLINNKLSHCNTWWNKLWLKVSFYNNYKYYIKLLKKKSTCYYYHNVNMFLKVIQEGLIHLPIKKINPSDTKINNAHTQ